jgi:hypothetical protein
MTESSGARRRLAECMDDRRAELGRTERRLTWERVADRAGLSVALLRNIRAGTVPITKDSKIGIEQALHWTKGSVDTVLGGGEPTVVPSERDPESITDEEVEEALMIMRAGLKRLYPPKEVDRRIMREREEITEAQKAWARRQRSAG